MTATAATAPRSASRPEGPPAIDLRRLQDDPLAGLARLRADHAIVSYGEMKYLVLRADEVIRLLSDPRIQTLPGSRMVTFNGIPEGYVARLLSDAFLLDNGVSHRTKRGLFARTFAHRAIRDARPGIRRVADRIVDDLPRGRPFDFVEKMASRLPAEMIAALLGLPEQEAAYFTARVYEVARAFTPIYPLADHDSIETAAEELFAYVKAHLVERVAAPQDDLLSSLVSGWQADTPISFDSLVHQVVLLVIGGSDTTRAAFAMLTALLAQHPEQWQAVAADPSLIPGAVLEGLRYEPSVGSLPRMAAEAMEIGGIEVPAGAIVGLSTLSAMRDPALYQDPDRFDITRTDHPRLHLVFGRGVHRCIGEMLARVEMEEGLAALLEAAPHLKLIEAPRMIGTGGIRQITPMRVCIPRRGGQAHSVSGQWDINPFSA